MLYFVKVISKKMVDNDGHFWRLKAEVIELYCTVEVVSNDLAQPIYIKVGSQNVRNWVLLGEVGVTCPSRIRGVS